MRYLRLIGQFARASFQEEMAYRSNFWINLLYSILNLATGILAIWVLFSQVETIQGWTFAGTLAILGVYLIIGALRNLVIGPSLESLAGMDGEVWSGKLDFTLIRPANTQFLASFRKWRPFALFDLVLGLGAVIAAMSQLKEAFTLLNLAAFLIALSAGVAILYAVLLAFSALVFWSPGVLFTWVFDGVFQMARYPLGLYPGWLQLVLTWIVPVGMITTIPAEALTGVSKPWMLAGMVGFAAVLFIAASALFRYGTRRYASASS